MKTTLLVIATALLLAGCDNKSDQTQAPAAPAPSAQAMPSQTPTTQPDNTGVNARDRDQAALTAGSQGQGKTDVEMAADVRSRIMAGKMSVNAQNVKVIFQNGKVTLRGPVNSQEEKDSIARMAGDVAGAGNVDNQLDVKSN